jgi:uncharacterized protein
VQSNLQRLIQKDPPLVKMLARQPGTKENRYAHLLAGEIEEAEVTRVEKALAPSASEASRIQSLEAEISELKTEIASLKQQFAEFRKQFE